MSKVKSKLKVGIIAKHDFYIIDAKQKLSRLNVNIKAFKSLADLNKEIDKGTFYDYLFFPHFSQIIPESIYTNFKCIGFHTGDLPFDRGGSPIQHKIIQQEYRTRVSAIKIEDKIDAGPIYVQANIDLKKGDIAQILKNLSKICAQMMEEIIVKNLEPKKQKESKTFKPRLSESDSNLGRLDLNLQSIYDRIRMVDGYEYPRAYIELGEYRLEFTEANFDGKTLVTTCKIRDRNRSF